MECLAFYLLDLVSNCRFKIADFIFIHIGVPIVTTKQPIKMISSIATIFLGLVVAGISATDYCRKGLCQGNAVHIGCNNNNVSIVTLHV